MRRSRQITLTIMSSLCLGGCDVGAQHWSRNYYQNRQDCVADYSEKQCEQLPGAHAGSGGGGRYYGPPYRTDSPPRDDPGSGRAGKADGKTSYVQRGGFGSSSRRFGGAWS